MARLQTALAARAYDLGMTARRLAAFTTFAALLLAGATGAMARVANAKLSQLLHETEVIVLVRVAEVQLDQHAAGHVVVDVVEVLRGESPGKTVRIDYSGEVHDLPMETVGDDWLLFLARRDGKWTGAMYGRSYWRLSRGAEVTAAPMRTIFDGKYRRLLRDGAVGLAALRKVIEDTNPPTPAALKAKFEAARGAKLGVACWVQPCQLSADFDRDRVADLALQVEEKAGKRRKGVAVITARGAIAIAGAGKATGNGGDDFAWMDAWKTEAAALIVEKTESASGSLTWKNRRLVWRQLGD